MAYSLSVQSEVILKIQEAFDWYKEQKDGLGYELLEQIRFCYLKLIKNPEHYSYINASYRRIKTARFPYILIYEIDGNKVTVISIRHEKQKPL
jgi:toxin ParE1/3/4